MGIAGNRQGRSGAIALLAAIAAGLATPAAGEPVGDEARRVIETVLAPPSIETEPGFKATLLTPPGELYDPITMVPWRDTVLMNDDGKASNGHGSRFLTASPDGTLSVLIDADRIRPVVGFDIAPEGFGNLGGQLLALSQPTTGMQGGLANHVIQRIDPGSGDVSVLCTLPEAGEIGNGVAGFGAGAAFGPAGSKFADRFFSITVLNKVVYQTEADGSCEPFVDLAETGAAGLAFTADGSAMLVTGTSADPLAPGEEPQGSVRRVAPDGTLDPDPVATGLVTPMGIAVAPESFGPYGGEIFLVDAGNFEIPVPQTQALEHDGKLYRITKAGELKLVASGFINPSALLFIDGHLWVSDINGDFIAGGRELPDGFLVRIDLE